MRAAAQGTFHDGMEVVDKVVPIFACAITGHDPVAGIHDEYVPNKFA